MLATRSAEVAPKPTIRAVSAKTLRQWCAPEVILVVTSLADETVILPHAIKQARQSGAKIVLAHVVTPQEAVSVSHKPLPRPTSRLQEARSIVDRMARQLRWLGFTCEPLVVTGHPHSEIPLIARNFCVDRVIVSFDDNPDLARAQMLTPIGQLWPKLDVPTCVIGRHVGLASPNCLLTRNLTLAVSLDSDCDVPLGFACRFAQELRAKLTILHVFGRGNRDPDPAARTPTAIASRLPKPTWREAELFCPAEITIREGEAAEEILKHGASTNQDLMILCSSGASSPALDWRTSVTYNVMAGAQCPVFVLPKQPCNAGDHDINDVVPEKVTAYGESVKSAFRKEEVM
jgi:nucleotide-binding universal stress UspA family protein